MVHTSAVPPPKASLRGRARNKLRLMGRFWQLYLLLHRLEEPYKEVFTLRTLGELPFAQIGALFQKGDGWARVIYYRAKQKIQEMLQEEAT